MESVGLRELAHHTAAIVRRVRDGETIVVTDHGSPVLRMVPAGVSDDGLSRLAAAGLLVPASTAGQLPAPIDTGAWTGEDATTAISAMRDE
ncbi:MAG TPA: type II toxin-antitoxin system prevent-host-death family antitoxin [Micromonosporaceae bacterium]|jgi:prevent-host-death family protein